MGRATTPTLGLVVARDLAIEGHVESYFYELSATGECEGKTPCFKLKPSKETLAGERHVTDKAILERRKAELDGADVPFETTVSRESKNPPLPYNLTMLIADMSKRFGMTADRTQQVTQDLRDKYKAITYNRSDSQYLKSEHFEQAPAVLGQAMENLGEDWELDFTIRSKAFNDDAVTAHHGIIPQEVSVPVGEMTEDERNVYRAVCERYAMQFMRPATYEVSASTFDVPEGQMAAKSRRVLDEGFEATFGKSSDDESDGESENAEGKAPWLDAGTHTLHSVTCRVERRKTAPPKPYTEGTLITDMASIAKYVSDPEVREVLKRKDEGKRGEHGGIGTTATRASIIRKLRERGYVTEAKGKLHATQLGRDLYQVLPPEIRGADMTARWWLMQQEVAEGKADVECVQRSVAETFRAHMATAYLDAPAGFGKKSVGRCPVCGSDVIALTARSGKAFYRCSASRPERQGDGTYHEVGDMLVPPGLLLQEGVHRAPGRGASGRQGRKAHRLRLAKDGKEVRLQARAQGRRQLLGVVRRQDEGRQGRRDEDKDKEVGHGQRIPGRPRFTCPSHGRPRRGVRRRLLPRHDLDAGRHLPQP